MCKFWHLTLSHDNSFEAHETKPKTFSAYCFSLQLAICIERKRQLNEDFQDCIGSQDHSSPQIEVKMVFLNSFFVI